jgi:hypothetical protein
LNSPADLVTCALIDSTRVDGDRSGWPVLEAGPEWQGPRSDRQRNGIGPGQFIEASYWAMDKQDNLYAGDTSVGRITKMVAPKK